MYECFVHARQDRDRGRGRDRGTRGAREVAQTCSLGTALARAQCWCRWCMRLTGEQRPLSQTEPHWSQLPGGVRR